MRNKKYLIAVLGLLTLCGCSSTSNLPEGEKLYTGLEKIKYNDPGKDQYFLNTQMELEAALACAPNGALLGSSYYRTPFQFKLWIYNAFVNSKTAFGKWILGAFGSEPVLMSNVNPAMRASVAQTILRNHGYFEGKVGYKEIDQSDPKEEKLSYDVTLNHLYTLDSIKYLNYPAKADSMIRATAGEALLRTGDPFNAATLEAERGRLARLFRNNGYYYYKSVYSSYLADSVNVPGKVSIVAQPVADIKPEVNKQYYIGNMKIEIRKSMMEQLTDSIRHRHFTLYFSGKRPPMRPSVILRDLKFRRGELFCQDKYEQSLSNISALGIYSMTDITYAPRDTTAKNDTLDVTINAVLDKPIDISLEGKMSSKSNDRMGPGLVLGLTKRNVFQGGEKINVKLFGSYEWQTGRSVGGNSKHINSYDYGGSVSLDYPRLEAPFFKRHRFYSTPSTSISLSYECLNRADYFKMTSLTAALTYKFQPSATSQHEFSPLILDFEMLQNRTARFDSIIAANPALYVSMRDKFVPKMKYTYTYTSPKTYRNPITWTASVTEAGNLLSLCYMAAGKKFNDKNKNIFGNPFAQFVKFDTDLRKTWTVSDKNQLVGHVSAGALFTYGNSDVAPYSEQFYVGGANSVRAFTIRSIGPGKYTAASTNYSYLDQVGTMKIEGSLEYRFNIFGNLYGATFLDAGNIWLIKDDADRPGGTFKPQNIFKQMATGTGAGLRYDMEFLVLRLDLGVALHVPYDTSKSGYYNIPRFKDGLGLHFAIGYPF
jgi:outer membrane protein assembly factor BamA